MHRTIPALLSGLALVVGIAVAQADEVGSPGTLAALQVNMSSADTYLQYHGRLFVRTLDGTLDEYRWGGTTCGSRTLTEEHTATLQRALHSKQVQIRPLYQDGQGQNFCLVGFNLLPKQSLKLGIP